MVYIFCSVFFYKIEMLCTLPPFKYFMFYMTWDPPYIFQQCTPEWGTSQTEVNIINEDTVVLKRSLLNSECKLINQSSHFWCYILQKTRPCMYENLLSGRVCVCVAGVMGWSSVIARQGATRSETLNEASRLHHRPCCSCNKREQGQKPEKRFGFVRQFESNRRESV